MYDALHRWTMTADEAVVYYDAFANGHEKITTVGDEVKYKMQKLNAAYGRIYLALTQRTWLNQFPHPIPGHFMWDAAYFGQMHIVKTSQTHFTSIPHEHDVKFRGLTYDDYSLSARAFYRKSQHNNGNILLKSYRVPEEELELTLSVLSVSPRVIEIDYFLSDIEIEHIMELTTHYNNSKIDSVVNKNCNSHEDTYCISIENERVNSQRGKKSNTSKQFFQSSTKAWIYREFSPIIDSLYRRVADLLQIDESALRHRKEYKYTNLRSHHSIAEPLKIDLYNKGQQDIPHHDVLYPSITDRYQPSRFASILFYLNDGIKGGETVFPRAITTDSPDGIKVTPKKGKAVLFYNVLPDGNVDDSCQHGSNKVLEGKMWIAYLSVWDPVIG